MTGGKEREKEGRREHYESKECERDRMSSDILAHIYTIQEERERERGRERETERQRGE